MSDVQENKLLEAALTNEEFDAYDVAAIKKELWLTKAFIIKDLFKVIAPQIIAGGSVLAITAGSFFGFMDTPTTVSIAAAASGSSATLFKKNDELEKQLNKRKK